MSRKTSPVGTPGTHRWRRLFEAALLERDNSLMPRRLKDAKDAVLDRITCDSHRFQVALRAQAVAGCAEHNQ